MVAGKVPRRGFRNYHYSGTNIGNKKSLYIMRILYTHLHKLRLCVVFPGFLVYMAYHYHWFEGQWLTFIFGPSVYAFTPIAAVLTGDTI